MKKLIAFFLISVLLFAAVACAGSSAQSSANTRGELTVYCDHALSVDLLSYFQANQACIVTAETLDENTDYLLIASKAGAALLKDEAVAEQLKAVGWTETEDWTEAQKKTNESMFNYIVLVSPANGEAAKRAAKLLTDWLAGDGTYDWTVTTVSGGCGCSRKQTTVTIKSDAEELAKSEQFKALVNP